MLSITPSILRELGLFTPTCRGLGSLSISALPSPTVEEHWSTQTYQCAPCYYPASWTPYCTVYTHTQPRTTSCVALSKRVQVRAHNLLHLHCTPPSTLQRERMAGGRGALCREDGQSRFDLAWGWVSEAGGRVLYPCTGVRPCERPSLHLSHTSRGLHLRDRWGWGCTAVRRAPSTWSAAAETVE